MRYYKIDSDYTKSPAQLTHYKQVIREKIEVGQTIVMDFEATKGQMESPILYLEGYIFVKDEMKEVLAMYDRALTFLPMIFVDEKAGESRHYWQVRIQPTDCLGAHAEVGFDKSLKKITLEHEKIIGQPILALSLIKDSKNPHVRKGLVVNLEVCESLLRRKILGLTYEQVEVE